MPQAIMSVLIVVPLLAALVCSLARVRAFRTWVVIGTTALLAMASLLPQNPSPDGPIGAAAAGLINSFLTGGDFLLLFFMLWLGCRHRHLIVIILTAGQLALLTWLEFFLFDHGRQSAVLFGADNLSLLMVRVVCLVGPLIMLHAIPYMQAHEAHQGLVRSSQPRFFAVLLLFLGAMNGLVLTNHLIHFYFFFELTTLCSYLLISHDGTGEAVGSALTALWMNGLGGLLLLLAIWGFYAQAGSLEISRLAAAAPGHRAALLPLALLILAAFTKSAQLPWQKWLLGAMAAPTPVSALLHSSTMVKAGVYLALRFAPALAHTMLAQGVLLAGGFTFLSAAALAIGQRNVKRVLAYSTISNLGLIFACAGLGTPEALAAGGLLIVFHAATKGLLFLCVGTAEQELGSRDLEMMRGLCWRQPFTGLAAVLAVLLLILPPFGMLLGKWLVLEAGADHTFFYLMLVLGSACTLLYWVRLAGTLLAGGEGAELGPERSPFLVRLPLAALAGGALTAGLFGAVLYGWVLASFTPTSSAMPASAALKAGAAAGVWVLRQPAGSFPLAALFLAVFLSGLLALTVVGKARAGRKAAAYLAGANAGLADHFTGPLHQPVRAEFENAYLTRLFGEARWTGWVNLAAGGLLLFILGAGGGLWS